MTAITFVKYAFYQPISIPIMLYITTDPFMAVSVAFHLGGSGQKNDRLKTNACKRLNLSLASFGFIGLLAKDIITTAQPLWIFACLAAMINSIKGYGYGLKRWDLKMMEGNAATVKDIIGGNLEYIWSVLAGTATFFCSAGYMVLAVTFGAMKCHTVYHLIFHVASAGPLNTFVWT